MFVEGGVLWSVVDPAKQASRGISGVSCRLAAALVIAWESMGALLSFSKLFGMARRLEMAMSGGRASSHAPRRIQEEPKAEPHSGIRATTKSVSWGISARQDQGSTIPNRSHRKRCSADSIALRISPGQASSTV